MDVKAIVFDLDGTLIDSSESIINSLFAALRYYKIEPVINRADLHLLMGKTLTETLSVLTSSSDKSVLDKVGKYYVDYYSENYMNNPKLFPEVKSTIESLYKKSLKMAVVTAKYTDCAVSELKSTELISYIDIIRGTGVGVQSKPDPTVLIEVCNNFDVDPCNVLVVGDTDMDILFGKNGGSPTAAVTYGNWSKDRFLEESIIPDFFIDNFSDILFAV